MKRSHPAGRSTNRRVPRRTRRSGAEARSAILKAAERRLLSEGPEAIRLQTIAADARLSHPAILHHFASREGLVEAMVVDGLTRLQKQFVEGWPSRDELDLEGIFDRFYEAASRRGGSRMLAWLILSGHGARAMKRNFLLPATERMHAGIVRRARRNGRRVPELEETMLAATFFFVLVFGESLFGPAIRKAIGLRGDVMATRRFRSWLTKVVERTWRLRPQVTTRIPPEKPALAESAAFS